MRNFLIKILLETKLCHPNSNLKLNRNYSHFIKNSQNSVLKESFVYRKSLFLSREVMKLSSVINAIEQIAPSHLAEKWDNTGLLIEPEVPDPISTIFLTNDLTEEVLVEALEAKANLIISYHPPIFSAMKRFVSKNWKDRIVMKCIANNIAVYSPHTACDAVEGGVNDWLIRCFGLTDVKSINSAPRNACVAIECIVPKELDLNLFIGSGFSFETLASCEHNEVSRWVKILVDGDIVQRVLKILQESPRIHSIILTEYKKPVVGSVAGSGRIGKLPQPLTLGTCIKMMKEHAKINNIRVAIGAHNTLDTEISVIAACAGSGTSVLKDVPADLYVTGEMSHHDILDCHHKGISVLLCEHSNSERGYLNDLANQLCSKVEDVKVIVSSVDKDPISIY